MPFSLSARKADWLKADAAVNPPQLGEALHCPAGEAILLRDTGLAWQSVIYAEGPSGQNGAFDEQLLRACYRNSLALAEQAGCESIALPLISAGKGKIPFGTDFAIAQSEIISFLENSELSVCLYLPDRDEFALSRQEDPELSLCMERFERRPLPQMMVDAFSVKANRRREKKKQYSESIAECLQEPIKESKPCPQAEAGEAAFGRKDSELESRLNHLDMSFSQMLMHLIDERDMTDVECYKRANLDRKLFSKIRSNTDYRPSKQTALAFCVALRLSREEAQVLLRTAGYALSGSSRLDTIVSYFLEKKEYDIFTINERLFEYDAPLLGG